MTVKKIGSAGGGTRDYTTVTAWLAAWPGTGANAVWQGECYNDSVFTQAVETFPITFNQANNSSNPIVLTAATGQSFADAASPVGGYNTSKGVSFSTTGTYGAARMFTITSDYITISRIQCQASSNKANTCVLTNVSGSATDHNVVDSCIFEGSNEKTDDNGGIIAVGGGQTKNCLIVNRNINGNGNSGIFVGHGATGGSVFRIDNCTVVTPTTYTVGTNAFRGSYNTTVVTNCAAFGFTNVLNNTARFTGSDYFATNASSVGVGTHNVTSAAFTTATFGVVVDTNHDFRLVSGSALLDVGFTDSTNVNPSVDAFGTSRPQGSAWDIGFHELVSGGVSVAITGNSITTSEGSLGKSVSHALTGNSSTTAEGTLGTNVNRRVALTGNSVTASEGAVSSKITHALTGNSSTTAQGTLTPSTGFNVALTGNQVTTSQGALGKAVSHALTGNQVTTSEGTLTPTTSGPVTLALTGNQIQAYQGNVIPFVPAQNVGGHFIPLTEKQLRELKKRQRKEHQRQEERDSARKLDADAIEADIRQTMLPAKAVAGIEQQLVVETDYDDDDEDLELILLHA